MSHRTSVHLYICKLLLVIKYLFICFLPHKSGTAIWTSVHQNTLLLSLDLKCLSRMRTQVSTPSSMNHKAIPFGLCVSSACFRKVSKTAVNKVWNAKTDTLIPSFIPHWITFQRNEVDLLLYLK